MDLSAYISFAAILDNSGTSPTVRIIDNSAYPPGVANQISGLLSITQPDGITDANTDFSHPNIYWNGGSLVQAQRPLRLATNNKLQNGSYSITYTVRCIGYTDTVLTKTFSANYTAPVPVLSPAFDNFTPQLKVIDGTNYLPGNITFISCVQSWAGLIRSVGGTNQNIIGSGVVFDLAYGGSYYDAAYDITLTSVVTYEIPDVSPWITLVDKIVSVTQTFNSEIPPSLSQLLQGLTTLKSKLDASINNPNYQALQQGYSYAVSLYYHLVTRGSTGDLSGLSTYVYQLQVIFNNGITPPYNNTNTPIPAYNWGGGGSSTTWDSITGKPSTNQINFSAGDPGYPAVGATQISDGRIANVPIGKILVFRGTTLYTKISKVSDASNTLSWVDALGTSEPVTIVLLAL